MSVSDVIIEPMSEEFILWRCLHGGPLSMQTIERVQPHPALNWPVLRARNVALLTKLIRVYGSCAIIARNGAQIVGQLRFYPKIIAERTPNGCSLCLQQNFPNGPAETLGDGDSPRLEQIADKTLQVHCLMTGSPSQKDNPYQRQGIGSRMVRELVGWARRQGWQAIEAPAYVDLPLVYEITGVAGKSFWEKLGFQLARIDIETAMLQEGDFVKTLRQQAQSRNMNPETIKNKYVMRMPLP